MPNVTPRTFIRAEIIQNCAALCRRTIHEHAPATRSNRHIITSGPQPTITNEEGTKTFRIRQHGNKSLPLPPLMDPIAIEAKERFKKPKAELEGRSMMTEFQRELVANPYAHALATPVRQCNITKARLPAHFLLPFSTVITSPKSNNANPGDNTPVVSKVQPALIPSAASDIPQDSEARSTGSSAYVLNRHSMLEHLANRKRWSSIVTPKMQEVYAKVTGKKSVKVDREWSWDDDTPEKVVVKLRRDVVERLKGRLDDKRRTLVVPWREIEAGRYSRVSAVLELAGSGIEAGEDDKEENIGSSSITPLVYSLQDLLGPEFVAQLPLTEELERPSQLAVLEHPRTTKLLLALDRLKMYTLPRVVQPQQKRVGTMNG